MMTIALLMTGAGLAAALGLYDAYSRGRGALGWLISIVASVAGGVAAGMALPMAVVPLLGNLGKDAALYVGLGGVVAGVLIGSSLLLWIVNRFR